MVKEDRKNLILAHIVHLYVSTATPVSSKIVAAKMGGKISSATIRNVMAELEEEGYIEQPHTSAGRIPTHFGYRHYVDIVEDNVRFEKRQAERLAGEYTRRIRTIKEVIERTSYLISRELHNAGIVMWPSIDDLYLKHLELIKLRSETVLAVLVTMTNAVKNHVINLDKEIKSSELERISNYINSNYEHKPFSDISSDIKRVIGSKIQEGNREVTGTAETALKIIDRIFEENIGNDLYWEGLDNFMDEPEFHDIKVTRRILQIFSEKDDLLKLLRRDVSHSGVKVYIGEEAGCDALNEFSLITCGYTLHGRNAGRLGVIGPTRMDYDHSIVTVRCLADILSSKLEEIEK